jgi:hypothetical protein
MDILPPALAGLNSYTQFILYKLVQSPTRPRKTDKLPVDYRTCRVANAHDATIWTDSTTAIQHAALYGPDYGVGFVFTKSDPFWFLDIDDCFDPATATWSPVSNELVIGLSGCGIELSSSGKGLHIIGRGNVPSHTCRNDELHLEFYTHGRFVALTGVNTSGSVDTVAQLAIDAVVDKYFKQAQAHVGIPLPPVEIVWNGPIDDEVLIDRMLRSRSARSVFNDAASFHDLWNNNAEKLAEIYGGDDSKMDAALIQHLAFWTGNDKPRMTRLLLRSQLARDKWDRADYLPRSIDKACSLQKEWLNDKLPEPKPMAEITGVTYELAEIVTGQTFLDIPAQQTFLAGCTYIMDEHKVLIPGGYLLTPDRFKTMYGGRSFVLDGANGKVTTDAWKAFTESQVLRHKKAHTTTFRPDLMPGLIIDKDGQTMANIWAPVATLQAPGDPTPFIDHIAILFPDPQDRQLLLYYLAATVQHQGIKFKWCPIIQGVEGNGKTLITEIMAFCIGHRYTHYPRASELTSKFNDWMYQKILIGVEDIYSSDPKIDLIEHLKPMITSTMHEIEPKGGAKVSRSVCCNFIINTNHKDGLRKTRNDRRFAPLYTAQQAAVDLKRDGLCGDYFPNFYKWRSQGGDPIINHYLHNLHIPDHYNPAFGQIAPITTSTEEAIEHGYSRVELEIKEAIESGVQGFRGGWISSIQLDKLLDYHKLSTYCNRSQRRSFLYNLGYIQHPHLTDGRVNKETITDIAKPRLYVHKDSNLKEISHPEQIAKKYDDDQK